MPFDEKDKDFGIIFIITCFGIISLCAGPYYIYNSTFYRGKLSKEYPVFNLTEKLEDSVVYNKGIQYLKDNLRSNKVVFTESVKKRNYDLPIIELHIKKMGFFIIIEPHYIWAGKVAVLTGALISISPNPNFQDPKFLKLIDLLDSILIKSQYD
jgi:hypothetical protein